MGRFVVPVAPPTAPLHITLVVRYCIKLNPNMRQTLEVCALIDMLDVLIAHPIEFHRAEATFLAGGIRRRLITIEAGKANASRVTSWLSRHH